MGGSAAPEVGSARLARRPQAGPASTDPSGRPVAPADRSLASRPVRLSSRRSDDADVIRARLRALLDGEPTAPGAGCPTTTPTITATPGERGRPSGHGAGRRRTRRARRDCPPASDGTGPPARTARWDPGRPGARSLWVAGLAAALAPVLDVAGPAPGRSRPRRTGAVSAADTTRREPRRRRSARSPTPPPRSSCPSSGSVARPGPRHAPRRLPRRRRGRGRRRAAAGRRPGVGQPRRRRHRRPADRRGRARRGGRPRRSRRTGRRRRRSRRPQHRHRRGAGRACPASVRSSPSASSTTASRARSPASTNWTTCPASVRPAPPSSPSW